MALDNLVIISAEWLVGRNGVAMRLQLGKIGTVVVAYHQKLTLVAIGVVSFVNDQWATGAINASLHVPEFDWPGVGPAGGFDIPGTNDPAVFRLFEEMCRLYDTAEVPPGPIPPSVMTTALMVGSRKRANPEASVRSYYPEAIALWT